MHLRHFVEDRRTRARPTLGPQHPVPAKVKPPIARRARRDMYLLALDIHIRVPSSTLRMPGATTDMALAFHLLRLPFHLCQTDSSLASHRVKVQHCKNRKKIKWRWTPELQQSTRCTQCSYGLLQQQSIKLGRSSNSLLFVSFYDV